MKYGHVTNSTRSVGITIIASPDGATWDIIGLAFTTENADLIVRALNEHDALTTLRNDLDQADPA